MTKASPLVGRAAEFPELASHFRTAYSNLDDYIQYGTEQREIFPTCLGPKSEFVPDLHIACEELGTSIGAHPTTILDPGKPFSTISFRGEGAPLMILTEELHHPLLTSGLSNCSSVWICATDENQAKGVHALLHVTPVNTNAKDAIARISAKFKEWGFPRRALAVVTGAYTDPTKYDMPQSPMALRRTALVAGKLVECVSELGYENVVDHTRRNRPPFVTKEVNVGGLMQISERTQKIEFVPIGRGIFGVPEAFQSAHAGS